MRFAVNRGLNKYGYKDGDPELVLGENHHPRCIDGSLDMRFKINRGLDKYNYKDDVVKQQNQLHKP
jgi:hypothetical protein